MALLYILMMIIYVICGAVIPSMFHFTAFDRTFSVIILRSIGSIFGVYVQTMYTLKNISNDSTLHNS
eukprot:UN08092